MPYDGKYQPVYDDKGLSQGSGNWTWGGGLQGPVGFGASMPTDPAAAAAAIGAPAGMLPRGGGGGFRPGRAEAALTRIPNIGLRELGMPSYMCGTPRYQMGGGHPGGPALVGEDGPEVVDLPPGSSVTPNPETILRIVMAVLAALQGGGEEGEMPSYQFGTGYSQIGGAGGIPGMGSRPSPFTPGQTAATRRGPFGVQIPGGPYGMQPSQLRGGQGLRGDEFTDASGRFNQNQGLQNLTKVAVRSGTFDPLGNPYLAEMQREQVMQGGAGRERAATLGADIDSGGDPALRAYARLNARLGTQAEASDAYTNARLQSAMQNQRFLQDVYQGQMGAVTRRDPREPAFGGMQIGLPGLRYQDQGRQGSG